MSNSRVSLSGSKITHMISRVGLVFGLFPLLALVEGIRLGEDLAPFFRDVGPFILSLLLVSYVSYSYRMVVERESDSGMVIFSRQILHSSIRRHSGRSGRIRLCGAMRVPGCGLVHWESPCSSP